MIPFVPARFFSPSNRSRVDWIVVHDMEAPLTPGRARAVADWFAGPNSPQASAHYEVDAGEVVQSVREQDVAWQVTSSGDVGNLRGIGIEHAGFAAWTPADWATPDAEAMLQRSAALAADLAQRWGIPIQWVDEAGLQRGERGFTGHVQITRGLNHGVGHVDPGPSFPVEHYLALVRAAAGDGASLPWGKIAFMVAGGLALGWAASQVGQTAAHVPVRRRNPLSNPEAQDLFDRIVMPAARENAHATEELSENDRKNETVAFARVVRDSASMIIDSMGSDRDFSSYVPQPISAATGTALFKLLDAEFAWMDRMKRVVIRAYRGGTKSDIAPASGGSLGPGFYFTTTRSRAEKYAQGGSVTCVDIRLQNALVGTKITLAKEVGFSWHVDPDTGAYDTSVGARLNEFARSQGYDGIVVTERAGGREIVVFDPQSFTICP